MDRDQKAAALRQVQALNAIADSFRELNRTLIKINTNLVQIGQNMKEDTDGGTSDR